MKREEQLALKKSHQPTISNASTRISINKIVRKRGFQNSNLTYADLTNLTIHYPNPGGGTRRISKYSFRNCRLSPLKSYVRILDLFYLWPS